MSERASEREDERERKDEREREKRIRNDQSMTDPRFLDGLLLIHIVNAGFPQRILDRWSIASIDIVIVINGERERESERARERKSERA